MEHTMNVNDVVDKEFQTLSFSELLGQPVSVFKGIGAEGAMVLRGLRVNTVAQLAIWRPYKIAKSVRALVDVESTKFTAAGRANLDLGITTEARGRSLHELDRMPLHVIMGSADWSDGAAQFFNLNTLSDIATFKYAVYAEAISHLSRYETARVPPS